MTWRICKEKEKKGRSKGFWLHGRDMIDTRFWKTLILFALLGLVSYFLDGVCVCEVSAATYLNTRTWWWISWTLFLHFFVLFHPACLSFVKSPFSNLRSVVCIPTHHPTQNLDIPSCHTYSTPLSHRRNKDSPYQRQIFHKDLPNFKAIVHRQDVLYLSNTAIRFPRYLDQSTQRGGTIYSHSTHLVIP